jgi:hypothetical protein
MVESFSRGATSIQSRKLPRRYTQISKEIRMAENTDPVAFCKGFVMGGLVGLVAAAYARGEFRRSQPFALDGKQRTPEPSHIFREHATELDMRREASENAGDPTRLAPLVANGRATAIDQAVTIERSSGNPGPTSRAELLEVPGQPGRTLDHSDAAQRVESALRTNKVSASRG